MTQVIDGVKLDFKDVLIVPKRSKLSSRKEVILERKFKFGITAIPIFASNMDSVGTFEMAEALASHGLMTVLHKFYSTKELLAFSKKHSDDLIMNNNVFVSSGIGEQDLLHIDYIKQHGFFPNICLDVANGYSERFVEAVKKLREDYPSSRIMVGNVCTPSATEELILAGADIVKIGIGPGSACETRLKTGVGYPQLSAIMECADAAHGLGGYVCGDGGCSTPGDVTKAFGGGADFVMLGGMFAGHYEGIEDKSLLKSRTVVPDLKGEYKNKPFDWKMEIIPDQEIEYYGMSSDAAMQKYHGGVAEHRTSEGKTVRIKYRGNVRGTVLDILGGLRSACTYVGSRDIKSLPKCTTFARVV